ncbi:hypothetical protein MF410_24985 (plasmid) [Rhizobium sp. C104]|uniref:hypothetical protein n=1 Tax=Rhizobium sp. C104 TaxID=2917727 RepID=UPI001EF79653|nr:hypothetical protein [Rhizobium sp. C104]ULJ81332.1 hypothetical protein MF410_24985 [Rhizobium sp. C104]
MNDTDRAIGKALEEHIIARRPRPDPDPDIEVVGDDGGRILIKLGDLAKANPRQWVGPSDVWLPYFSKNDLDDWAAFLLPRLDRLVGPSPPETIDPSPWAQRLLHFAGLFRSK